jgi:nondiscriminating glutamyl-tRNA synthetase
MTIANFRTRQAPSPTGYLHLGTARTVLYTKLLAQNNHGEWYLRLDDTDRNRLNTEAVPVLINALYSIGLQAPEGLTLQKTETYSQEYNIYQQGDLGPYIQSERLAIYHEHANKMIQMGLCYWSYLSTEKRQELQDVKQNTKQPINWYQASLVDIEDEKLLNVDVETALNDPRKPCLRYKLQRKDKVVCKDLLLGNTEFDLKLLEDVVFIKTDGYPSYHFAHLIDDHLTKVTHVIRSQEWYPSLPLHTQSFIDYWGKDNLPDYIHLPFILGTVGNKKMSKRDGKVNMQDYLDQGFLPEAIVNYLAFLGWNPGTEQELFLDKADFQ